MHCKAFRRLTHKTQVFVAPEGDHYRTRLTHTLEVTTISRTVARALRLNEDLVEAIGLGHDLGHPPFGHIGEEVLDRCLRERFGGGFRHYEHSLRVVEQLERDGAGLNLTEQVRDGIARHSEPRAAARRRWRADRARDRPRRLHQPRHRRRAARGLLRERRAAGRADRGARRERLGSGSTRSCTTWSSTPRAPATSSRASAAGAAMSALREFMFERVYLGPAVRAEHERIAGVVRALFEHYVAHPELLPAARAATPASVSDLAQRVTDYLAGMTDRYCIREYTELAGAAGVRALTRAAERS